MYMTAMSGTPKNQTQFRPGQRGYVISPVNPIVVIGEDDDYVWTIIDRPGGGYYGIAKREANLAGLHITSGIGPVDNMRVTV